jgi:hypothetical protein
MAAVVARSKSPTSSRLSWPNQWARKLKARRLGTVSVV